MTTPLRTGTETTVISPEDPRRRLALGGTHNFRDVGGYPLVDGGRTRWGVLYRSDSLDALTSADREILADRGLRTVLDLREEAEYAPAPDDLGGLDALLLSVPVYEDTLFQSVDPNTVVVQDYYCKILRDHQHQLAAAVGCLGDVGRLPAIVHCTAGKDRTGLVVAIVLTLVGVPTEWILRDYEASQHILGDGFVRKVKSLYDDAGLDQGMLGDSVSTPSELLAGFLESLRMQHGSVETFLSANGVSTDQMGRIRDTFTVTPVHQP